MPEWATPLLNFGGMGVLSLALLMLHRDSIRSFTEQLQKERDANTGAQKADREAFTTGLNMLVETANRRHEQTITALVAQDRTLVAQDRTLDRILTAVSGRRPPPPPAG